MGTPPLSPVLRSDMVSASCARIVEQELIVEAPRPQFAMENPVICELPDLTQFEDTTVTEPALAEILGYPDHWTWQVDTEWSNWIMEAELPNLTPSPLGCPLVVIDRYSKLLDSLPWFEFADWLTSRLNNLLQPRSAHASRLGSAELPVVVRNVMKLSKAQPGGVQKAVESLSGVIPERFNGELVCKINGFDAPMHAQVQAAEILLSLLANNHRSISDWTNSSQLRKWIMEIPVTLLELILQREDPTAVAIANQMLVWSVEHGYSDVFHQLLKAKINKTYLSGVQGGKLLLKTLRKYSALKEISMDIMAYNPSLDELTSDRQSALHLAAINRGPQLLEALINQGANLEALDNSYHTPFEAAVFHRKTENAKWFLDNGASTRALESILNRSGVVLTLEMCEMLWDKYPKASSKIPACLLIYSAISGVDEFATKLAEVSRCYDNVTSILEEALCIVMKTLHDYDWSEPFHEHYWSLNASQYEDSDDGWEGDESLNGGDVLDFLKHGVDPNTASVTDHPPPLVSAIKFWTAEEVETLLNHGAKLNQREVMKALFHGSASSESFEIIRHIFMDRKARIEMEKRLPNGWYPLQAVCATHKGSEGFSIVKYFIENGAQVNSRVSQVGNYTALHYAVQHGQLETTRYLIQNGARVRRWLKAPSESLYALCLKKCPATCGWHVEEDYLEEDYQEEVEKRIAIWELLLQVHAEIDNESETIALNLGKSLAQAITTWKPKSKLVETVIRTQAVMSEGVLISEYHEGKNQSLGPFSPLQLAVKYDDIKTVEVLVKNGANVNEAAGYKNGGTALQIAILRAYTPKGFNLKLVSYLLDHGADVNAIGAKEHGRTALQQACELKVLNYQLIHLLLKHNADVNGPPAEISGRTALQLACLRDEIDFELIRLLMEHGSDINAPAASTKGITALQGAVINGNIELVVYLLERGAQVDAAGARVEGRNALEAAAEYGRLTIAQILLNAYKAVGAVPELNNAIALGKNEGHLGVVKLFKNYQRANS